MSKRANRWSCGQCGVSVGRIDGAPADIPVTWTESGESAYCLTCSRERAAAAAVATAPESSSREDRVRSRRSALIAFEISRRPSAPDRAIANACRTSALTVAAVRATLPALPPSTDSVPDDC